MVHKGLVLCAFLILLGFGANAQDERVEIIKDPLISALQEFRATHAINPDASNTPISFAEKKIDKRTAKRVRTKGFRVQIFSGSSRSEAVTTQNSFLRKYSDMGAYLNYDEPNFRVKVGDFKTRSEANSFLRKIRGQYSNVFVFVEDIWVWQ